MGIIKYAFIMWLVWVLISLALFIGGVYVVMHFIIKLW